MQSLIHMFACDVASVLADTVAHTVQGKSMTVILQLEIGSSHRKLGVGPAFVGPVAQWPSEVITAVPMCALQLVNCGLSDVTIKALEARGITALFPIQKHVYEPAAAGRLSVPHYHLLLALQP